MPLPSKPAARDLAEMMCVPGATMSGLVRPSSVGPRLENGAMSSALSAPVSGKHWSAGDVGRTPSEAPTVITFFAVPGAPIVL